jgi:hypothetical protein
MHYGDELAPWTIDPKNKMRARNRDAVKIVGAPSVFAAP